jgi:hypothetical protein
MRATQRLSAATIAMADCHRRVLPAPRNVTVARLYSTTLGQQLKRAVKTRKVWCAFRQMVCLPAYITHGVNPVTRLPVGPSLRHAKRAVVIIVKVYPHPGNSQCYHRNSDHDRSATEARFADD